jgi:RimJ/RimL family protein N-acetyltransferase
VAAARRGVTLRPPTSEDLDQVLSWRNRPDVIRWLLRTEVDRDAFRETWLGAVDDPRDHSVVALLARPDGEVVVGTGSLWVVDAVSQSHVPDGPWRAAEGGLGYLVDPAQAGKGFATTIASALLDLAFRELRLHRVTAGCFADNTASWKVMEKLGMRREQHSVKDAWHGDLGWVDGFTYAILADEWRSGRCGPKA